MGYKHIYEADFIETAISVAAVNLKAAYYLILNQADIFAHHNPDPTIPNKYKTILTLLDWEASFQGRTYWDNICQALKDLGYDGVDSSTNACEHIGLIARVRLVDEDAADYLLYKAPTTKHYKKDDILTACIVWDDSPQGFDFWYEVNKKLNGMKGLTYPLLSAAAYTQPASQSLPITTAKAAELKPVNYDMKKELRKFL